MDLKNIKVIIDLMRKNSLSEFEMEKEGFKIKLRRGASGASTPSPVPPPEWIAAQPAAQVAPVAAPAPAAPVTPEDEAIKSPMIGTFYRAPAPDAADYVEVGSEVGPETVVCIIEAMKVMNEIKAEVKGKITEIVAENGKPVEFGQPLFKIRPA